MIITYKEYSYNENVCTKFYRNLANQLRVMRKLIDYLQG
jgi:hypothetical protein